MCFFGKQIERKHLVINKLSVKYIKKESNELEESDIVGVTDEDHTKYVNVKEIILGLDVYKDYKEIGLSKSNCLNCRKKQEMVKS